MADIDAIKIGGGALAGAIAALLGIKKMIKQEICEGIKPVISSIEEDVKELKEQSAASMSREQHKLICTMNSDNVNRRFEAIKDHIDLRFDELNKRLGT